MDSPEVNKKVEELQILERQLQNFLMQKQGIQIEINEVNNALAELGASDEEVYKVVSGFMIKSTKDKLTKELEEKKKLLDSRISALEKQENLLNGDADKLKKEIDEAVSKKE